MKKCPNQISAIRDNHLKVCVWCSEGGGCQDVRRGVPRPSPRPRSRSKRRKCRRRSSGGGSRPGPVTGAGRMESSSLLPLPPGEWECKRTQSMAILVRPTVSPASSPATTLSVRAASRAGVWMANCHVQSVGEWSQSHNLPASLWPQSLCYRKVTSLRDGHSVPPTDSLLRFLVESSSDEYPSCANCDRNEKSPMFFCNTCGKWWSWMGGGSGNTTTFLSRSVLQFNKGNFKVEINNFGKYEEPILVLLQNR